MPTLVLSTEPATSHDATNDADDATRWLPDDAGMFTVLRSTVQPTMLPAEPTTTTAADYPAGTSCSTIFGDDLSNFPRLLSSLRSSLPRKLLYERNDGANHERQETKSRFFAQAS